MCSLWCLSSVLHITRSIIQGSGAVVKVDRRIRWHYTTAILRLRIGARLTRYRNCKFHNFARTISWHADGISRYSVPSSAGPLLPRAVFDGGLGVEPFRENFWPPLLLLKNARGVDFNPFPSTPPTHKFSIFLCTYALARSSTSIAKTSTPLMKFDKYSPAFTPAQVLVRPFILSWTVPVLPMLQLYANSRNRPTATDEKSLLYFGCDFTGGWYNFGKIIKIFSSRCHILTLNAPNSVSSAPQWQANVVSTLKYG